MVLGNAPVVASVLGVLVGIVVMAVVAAITTVLSLRLLGIRRGWLRALVSGLLGWGVALLLGLALQDWDWSSDDLALYVLAIGIPATMLVAVTFDLLARPGSLAVGERAGLLVAPRPVRAVSQRVAVFRRYRELLRLARREGFGPMLSEAERAEHASEPMGVRMRRVLEEAGGVYVKLGQIAATRVDLIPADVADELAELQNRVAPESLEVIRPALEAELGRSVDEVFAEFDWEPLAAASIGQTYLARLHSGEAVVVKVQRPGIADIMERDLAALALLADFAQRRTTFGLGIRSGEVLAQFAISLRAELDFRHEADAMAEMALLLEGSGVRVPAVYTQYSTRRLLVQERFDGFTVSDRAGLEAAGIDRREVAQALLRTTIDQVLRLGVFHADPHPGNIFVFHDGTLGLIDFGAIGRLDPIQQAAVVDMLFALMQRDVGLLRDGVERVADVQGNESPERLERALARLVAENVKATGNVEPSVMQDLVATLAQFGIRLPGDLVVLSRALVTVDGTLRLLAPDLSLVSVATESMTSLQPVVDRDELIKQELTAALPHLRRLPDRVDRILTLASRGDLRLKHVVDEDSRRILRTLTNRALLLVAGATFMIAAVLLLGAGDPGPAVSDDVGLFEVFGYFGLLAGAILVLRVVAAVTRDGTT
jgi:ubiquinone biosynthesis protein